MLNIFFKAQVTLTDIKQFLSLKLACCNSEGWKILKKLF
jgi:hypothetical protein